MVQLPLNISFTRTERLSDEEFYTFCRDNADLRIERQADGTITIQSPESLTSGKVSPYIHYCLYGWKMKTNLGQVFSSSTGFTLPDSSVLSANASWVSWDRLKDIPRAEWNRFARVSPNFVVEVLSPSDSMKATERKMQQWVENGTQLGWLIDPVKEIIKIYTAGDTVKTIKKFESVIVVGDLMPGFQFDLQEFKQMIL
jgi:Uma2 family endonuclease